MASSEVEGKRTNKVNFCSADHVRLKGVRRRKYLNNSCLTSLLKANNFPNCPAVM